MLSLPGGSIFLLSFSKNLDIKTDIIILFFSTFRPKFLYNLKNILYYIFLGIFLFASAVGSYAQDEQQATDSIFHYEDTNLYKQKQFYNNWKEKASKHKWSNELFNILFDPPTATTPKSISKNSIARSFASHEGKWIRKITFTVTNPFGKTVNGLPTDSTDNKLAEFGNRVHMRTKVSHLKRVMSLNEGEPLDIKLLEENEEKLRSLGYIDEVFLTVTDIGNNEVEIDFILKDRFAWSFSYQANNLVAHKAKVYNKNLWGLGHNARVAYYYNPDKHVQHSLGFEYSIPSIGNSKIQATAIAENTHHNKKLSLELDRTFIDYRTKYAGGLKVSSYKDADHVPTNDIARFDNEINFHEVDLWGGTTLPFNLEAKNEYARYRKALTARLYRVNFTKHPEIKADTNVFLLKTTGALLGYNVSKQQLFLSNLMYSYGRVENIPYGYLAQIFVGTVYNDWNRKGYIGLNFSRGYYNARKSHYFSTRLSGGTFLNRQGFLDGLISAEFSYISRLYRFRDTKHRHFFKVKYIVGLNPTDDFLNLNEDNGLRNFKSEETTGDRKLVVNVEDVFFSPMTIAGFRTAFFSFLDLGYIASDNSKIISSDNIYGGVGLGVRLNNDNFVFKTFQISFSLFFKRPDDVSFFRPDASSVKRQEFTNFYIEKPYFFFQEETFKR